MRTDQNPRQTQRRLAAMMFTDIAGYSRMTEHNEQGTHELLSEHNRIIREVLPEFGGREIRTIGDAFFIEFPSAVDAVECAYRIQARLHEWNLTLAEESRLLVRIGLHLGDILDAGDDSFGNEVNVSARLESLAQPGGICISQQILDQVRGKVDFEFKSMGLAQLKNIKEGVAIWSIALPWTNDRSEKTLLRWSEWRARLYALPLKGFRTPVVASRTLIAAFVFGLALGFAPPIYRGVMETVNPDVFRAGNRGPAGMPAPQSLDENDWKIQIDPPASNWEDLELSRPGRHVDRVRGEYWLKKEFVVNAKYRDPAIVLGVIPERTRVYLDGHLIGASEYQNPVPYFVFDPTLTAAGRKHTLLIKAHSRGTLTPGLTIVPRIGAYLGDVSQIAPLVRTDLLLYHLVRMAYLSVTVVFFFGFLIYHLINPSSRNFLYYGMYGMLGSLLLIYHNRVMSDSLGLQLQLGLRTLSMTLGPMVLASAYFASRKNEVAERRNNWGALVFGLVGLQWMIFGDGKPIELQDRANALHLVSVVYSLAIFGYLGIKLLGGRTTKPEGFRAIEIATVFFIAVNGAFNAVSIRGGLALALPFETKTFVSQFLIIYPVLFMVAMFGIALIDYSMKNRVLRFRKDSDALNLDLTRLLARPGDASSQLDESHNRICAFLGISQSTLYLRDGDRLRARHRIAGPSSRGRVLDIVPMDQGVIGYVARTRHPILARNIALDLRFRQMMRERPRPTPSYATPSCMLFPLICFGEVTGVLTFTEKSNASIFTQEDFELVQSLLSDITLLSMLENATGGPRSVDPEEPRLKLA